MASTKPTTHYFVLKLTTVRGAQREYRVTMNRRQLDHKPNIDSIAVNFRLNYGDVPTLRKAMKRAAARRSGRKIGFESVDTMEGHVVDCFAY